MRERDDLIAMLEDFRHKARCRHSQATAHQLWRTIRPRLVSETAAALGVAWEHSLSAEGPAELDSLVDQLIVKLTDEKR